MKSTKKEINNERFLIFIKEHLKSNPNQFALSIGIDPSTITNIIANRNEPSSLVLTSIAKKYPELDINWLLLGRGEMLIDTPNQSKKSSGVEAPAENNFDKRSKKDEEKEFMATIHNRIKTLREEGEYTMEDIASVLGMKSTSGYSAMEYNGIQLSIPKLVLLSKFFKKSYNYLIHGTEDQLSSKGASFSSVKEQELNNLKDINAKLEKEYEELNNKNLEAQKEIEALNKLIDVLNTKIARLKRS